MPWRYPRYERENRIKTWLVISVVVVWVIYIAGLFFMSDNWPIL